ncbi:uncharacterized protein PMUG01_10046500 [Plasmodium malariae]|uniref:Uncharacterized protein n=1 Tax=Plasmodium malariae TaxID=5858 RepID=A0A1D3RJT6_PLAMA|nr:uncharacterized protein PMUG01_10046500 [Plasmodium malariae]SCN45226.1 hypothetical protein PMUG01_10046500 [Plasmodium malariae]
MRNILYTSLYLFLFNSCVCKYEGNEVNNVKNGDVTNTRKHNLRSNVKHDNNLSYDSANDEQPHNSEAVSVDDLKQVPDPPATETSVISPPNHEDESLQNIVNDNSINTLEESNISNHSEEFLKCDIDCPDCSEYFTCPDCPEIPDCPEPLDCHGPLECPETPYCPHSSEFGDDSQEDSDSDWDSLNDCCSDRYYDNVDTIDTPCDTFEGEDQNENEIQEAINNTQEEAVLEVNAEEGVEEGKVQHKGQEINEESIEADQVQHKGQEGNEEGIEADQVQHKEQEGNEEMEADQVQHKEQEVNKEGIEADQVQHKEQEVNEEGIEADQVQHKEQEGNEERMEADQVQHKEQEVNKRG